MAKTIQRQTDFTKTDLKERGWTERLIGELLGSPDEERPNPHYASGPTMKLYLVQRVRAAERRVAFQRSQKGRVARFEAAKKAAATRTRNEGRLIDEFVEKRSASIKIPEMAEGDLVERAKRKAEERRRIREVRQFEWEMKCLERGWDMEQDVYDGGEVESDEAYIRRICVNYLRHCCSEYDAVLGELADCKADTRLADKYVKAVFDTISQTYPHLASECRRQLQDRR
jgi:hypothetical protein